VELASAPMKTRFGLKIRPEFRVTSWRTASGASRLEPLPTQKLFRDAIAF